MLHITPPESNADTVALHIAIQAVGENSLKPGEPLARLFETMAKMARNIAADNKAAGADWHGAVDSGDLSDMEGIATRQVMTACELWSQEWMLTMIAKHLYERLEDCCLSESIGSHLEQVEYQDDGKVKSWKLRDGPLT